MSHAVSTEATETPLVTTTPAEYPIRLVGLQRSKEESEQLGYEVSALANSISQHMNLSALDGITISHDFMAGLMSLDHGYPVNPNMRHAKSARDGISLSPIVVRDGQIKSHMIFREEDVSGLITSDDAEAQAWAMQVVAYECAQVTVRNGFHVRFPEVLLRQQLPIVDLLRWTVITNSWDAFAATSLSVSIGQNPTEQHEAAFLELLERCPAYSNQLVSDYRTHRNVDGVLRGQFELWGTLIKYAGYLLGALDGTGKTIKDLPLASGVLENHWFKPTFDALSEIFVALAKEFGRWENSMVFEPIGDLAQNLVASAGLYITRLPDGQAHVHIPMTPATS